MKLEFNQAYVKNSEKKEEEYGTWTEATIADGESDIVLRSYDEKVDLRSLKPKTVVNLAVEGDFGKPSQYGIRFEVTKLTPVK